MVTSDFSPEVRNAYGHNYWNSSFIIDGPMGQIPRSTERISSLCNNFFCEKPFVHNCVHIEAIISEME